MVTQQTLDEAKAILIQVVNPAPNVIVVPASMSVGDANNPAICIKKAITKKWVTDQLSQPEIQRGFKDVDVSQLSTTVDINTLVISEGVFDRKTPAYKSAVVWHEHGHVLHGPAESGNVYLYEVTCLHNAGGLDTSAVSQVVRARISSYKLATDPGVGALRTFLQNTWAITI